MVAVAFPEAETVFVEQNKTANPLDAFPGVEMGEDEADRAAMLGGEWSAIVVECEQNMRALHIFEWNVCGIFFFGEQQNVFGFGFWLDQLQNVAEENTLPLVV